MPQGWIVPAAVDTDFLTGGFSGVRCRLTVINLLHCSSLFMVLQTASYKIPYVETLDAVGYHGHGWGLRFLNVHSPPLWNNRFIQVVIHQPRYLLPDSGGTLHQLVEKLVAFHTAEHHSGVLLCRFISFRVLGGT